VKKSFLRFLALCLCLALLPLTAGAETEHTVTFVLNGGTMDSPLQQKVADGETITWPSPSPVKEGYRFVGWFCDAAETTRYGSTTPVTQDITLYARWTRYLLVRACTLDELNKGGQIRASWTASWGGCDTDWTRAIGAFVKTGEVVTIVAQADEGYTFKGWSYSQSLDDIFTTSSSYTFTFPDQPTFEFRALFVSPPTITTQPSDATVNEGSKAIFKVVASDADSYQWQYKDAGGSWTNSGYTSAKTATLSFTAKASMSGRQYQCLVTNSAGTTTSNAATLTVNSKPVITTQPSNATVTEGNKATFKVVASGTGLSYQWQYKDAGGSWTNSGYSSAKTATLSFTAKADMNGRQYQCLVTNSAGTATSNAATLTVNVAKPTITAQPTNATVTAGNKATFKVTASGTGLTYQWQYKDAGGSWTNSGYSSAKTATLSFPTKANMNGRQYQCLVTNSAGTTTSSAATLTVNAAKPTITTQPTNATVTAGNKATFTVAASGTGLSYQWQYKDAGGSWTNSGYSSAKTATLTFTAKAEMNGRQYRCKVTNSAGTTTSSAVTLTVNSKPAITSQPSSATVTAGNKATFKVTATGASSYQWQYKDEGGSWTDSGYSSAKTATLSFPTKASMNGRQYRCKVTNSVGTATSSTATLTVK